MTDLHWMPYHGEINNKGTLSYENAGNKVTNQFISIAGDGMVLFWDLRVRDRKKQPRRSMVKKDRDGDQDLWAPIYSIKLEGLKPSGGGFRARARGEGGGWGVRGGVVRERPFERDRSRETVRERKEDHSRKLG